MRDAISSCNLIMIVAEMVPVQINLVAHEGGESMFLVDDLDQLVDLLAQAQKVSERVECKQVKLLIELAMFELGTSIAQRNLSDLTAKEANPT